MRLNAPVLAAAVARMERAQGLFCEIVDRIAGPEPMLVLRELHGGRVLRVHAGRGVVDGFTRWRRALGWFVEVGDGTWFLPSLLFSSPAFDDLEAARAVDLAREGLRRSGLDPEEVDPAAPGPGLARRAGIAFGALVGWGRE